MDILSFYFQILQSHIYEEFNDSCNKSTRAQVTKINNKKKAKYLG